MGSSEWCVSSFLDAHSCAAAGQKLTLDRGLGRDISGKKAGTGIAPCPFNQRKSL
jgi:hypothetical protein